MPVIRKDGHRFVPRWRPEWISRLDSIAQRYRNHKGLILWARARDNGELNGLPDLSTKDISRYYSVLQKRRGLTPEQRAEYSRRTQSYRADNPYDSAARVRLRRSFYHGSGAELSRRHPQWTAKQKETLMLLCNLYWNGRSSINWRGLVQDNMAKSLPTRDIKRLQRKADYLSKSQDSQFLEKHSKEVVHCRKQKHFRAYQAKLMTHMRDVQRAQMLDLVPLRGSPTRG